MLCRARDIRNVKHGWSVSEEESWTSLISAGVLTVQDLDKPQGGWKISCSSGSQGGRVHNHRCLPASEAAATRGQATRQQQLYHCFMRPSGSEHGSGLKRWSQQKTQRSTTTVLVETARLSPMVLVLVAVLLLLLW